MKVRKECECRDCYSAVIGYRQFRARREKSVMVSVKADEKREKNMTAEEKGEKSVNTRKDCENQTRS